MRTMELSRTRGSDTSREVVCAFAVDGLCDAPDRRSGRCERCERYAELLRSARELYADVRWFISPDGMLYDVDARGG